MADPVDRGHEKLLADLRELLALAEAFEFHDFKNTQFPFPKIALNLAFEKMAARTREGAYDNKP